MAMRFNCPKCGRLLEEGEIPVSDGCMYCASFNDTASKQNRQSDEPIGPLAWIVTIIIALGIIAFVFGGFLLLLGVGL